MTEAAEQKANGSAAPATSRKWTAARRAKLKRTWAAKRRARKREARSKAQKKPATQHHPAAPEAKGARIGDAITYLEAAAETTDGDAARAFCLLALKRLQGRI